MMPPNGKIFDPADHRAENNNSNNNTNNNDEFLFPQIRISPEYLRNGRRSLSGIARNAAGLGVTFGVAAIVAVQLVRAGHYLWRIPVFVATLAVFHFLEFDMTARFNPPDAKVSSFLLFNNGRAYNIAHSVAMLEVIVRYIMMTRGTWPMETLPHWTPQLIDRITASTVIPIGILLVVMGQTFRSMAMKQAGTSFNHLVQSSKKEDHVLVTTGIYAISRHPAYFGFFWWGLGTQILLGNWICLFGYAVILWKFFAHRIMHEEKHLILFFGQAYERYRQSTPVHIPFIR